MSDLYFLHIGKCGGTSFDKMMYALKSKLKRKYFGKKHFDWSYILKQGTPTVDLEVLTMLRHPVERAVSQFHYSKTLDWTKDFLMRTQTISEYLRDEKSIEQYSQPLNEGESGMWWLSGCFFQVDWIATDGEDTECKENLRNNNIECLIDASKNLDKTLWFGLLEDIPRSMELLKHSLNLDHIPKFPIANATKHDRVSIQDAKIIEKYIKYDILLYEYSKLLFEARWKKYKGEPYIHPNIEDIISLES